MKTYSKVIAGALAVMLSAGATGMYAMANDKEDKSEEKKPKAADTEVTASQAHDENGKTYKEETVYVMTKASGAKDKVIVSDWLKNPKGLTDLEDVSNLTDIENTKTDETYTASGSKLTWKTEGGDIYYKGNYSGDLPVEMKVTYTLDGKETKPEDMAGKSGKVTIRYDFTNNAKRTINVNGKDQEVCVPFLMTTGSILDSDVFSNVTVTNGKVISDGNKQIFVGIAVPGLKESLDVTGLKEKLEKENKEASDKLAEKDVEIPDYVELTADVRNFEMPTVFTLATSNLLSNAEIDTSDIVEQVDKKLKEMTDGVDQLCEGSGKLSAGLATLNSSVTALPDGVAKLYAGSGELNNGLKSANDGAGQLAQGANTLSSSTAQLTDGIAKLKNGSATLSSKLGEASTGAQTLAKGAGDLAGGFAQIDSKLPELTAGAAQLKDGAQQLSDGASQLKDGSSKLTAGLGEAQKGVAQLQAGAQQLSGAMDQQLDKSADGTLANGTAQVSAGAAQVADNLSKMNTQVANLPTQVNTLGKGVDTAAENLETTISVNEQVLAGLEQLNTQSPSQSLATSIATLEQTIAGQKKILASLKTGTDANNPTIRDGVTALEQGAGTIKTSVGALSAGAAQVKDGAAKVDAGAQKLMNDTKNGAQQLFGGLKTLNDNFTKKDTGILDGSKALTAGLTQLDKGAGDLNKGVGSAASGIGQLTGGLKQLSDGSKQLNTQAPRSLTAASVSFQAAQINSRTAQSSFPIIW